MAQPSLRIGYLIPQFPSQTHAFFWREAQALADSGAQVQFLSTRHPGPELAAHAFAAEAVRRTTYLFPGRPARALALLARRPRRTSSALGYALSLPESSLLQRIKALALVLPAAQIVRARQIRPFDHLHVHSFANAAHIAAMAHRLDGLPYSLVLHGDLPVYGRDHAAKCAEAVLVIAVTAPLCDQIRAALPGVKPRELSMGTDPDRFRPRAAPRPANGPLHVAAVARLNYAKGHAYLFQAIASAVAAGHDITCTVAGSGPYEAEVRASIAELGLQSLVTMVGSIGEAEVLALLQNSDAFALTSFGQGEAAPVAVRLPAPRRRPCQTGSATVCHDPPDPRLILV